MNDYDDYYKDKLSQSGDLYKGCMVCIVCIITLLVIMLFCGCRSVKSAEKEKTEKQDSVRIEYREKIVKVPVTVYVEVPVESKEKVTNDSTSHLETSFAVSDASMVWIDGVPFLRHSLENKPQKIAKNDSVPVVEKEKAVWKTRRVTYTKTEILEAQLSWWQKTKLRFGEVSFGLNIVFILSLIFMFRFLRRK